MNTIIAIGYISDFRCFLNMSVEEALSEYKKELESQNEPNVDEYLQGLEIKEIKFEDRFNVYEINSP